MTDNARALWDLYQASELAGLTPLLKECGFALDAEQPHVLGERYLMQAVTTASGRKLILLGAELKTGRRVVIKATSDEAGRQELRHERRCREVLNRLPFAYDSFLFPDELYFRDADPYTFSVQAFIPQERSFLERPIEEQFILALRSFKAQEGAHASTYAHLRLIERTFGRMDAAAYSERFTEFKENVVRATADAELHQSLNQAEEFLREHVQDIDQYGSFLTHTDFVPHNIRVADGKVYLLDHSSLRFGNKYEGWARFLNFMALYNPPLEEALRTYVRDNRTPEESVSLKVMRLYRLGEILWYYTNTLDKSEGDLLALNRARISWWQHVLAATFSDVGPNEATRKAYQTLRDQLRSPEEKRRQEGLH